MNKVKVKYCGLKTPEDIESAKQAQVDAVGFVFVEKSPRYIAPEKASELSITAKLAGIKVVALFADHEAEFVQHIIKEVKPDILQFHGSETAAFCEQFEQVYWKAIPMLEVTDYQSYMDQYPKAQAFLLDAFGKKQSGGSGQPFKWFQFSTEVKQKMILAGGIHSGNVVTAVAATGTQFIDTSSGIESVPGVKSKSKMLALMEKINAINLSQNNN